MKRRRRRGEDEAFVCAAAFLARLFPLRAAARRAPAPLSLSPPLRRRHRQRPRGRCPAGDRGRPRAAAPPPARARLASARRGRPRATRPAARPCPPLLCPPPPLPAGPAAPSFPAPNLPGLGALDLQHEHLHVVPVRGQAPRGRRRQVRVGADEAAEARLERRDEPPGGVAPALGLVDLERGLERRRRGSGGAEREGAGGSRSPSSLRP